MSQLELSLSADISARHLSFVETGRAKPTSAMVIRLAEQLEVPLRERNVLLLAAGYAPQYPQHDLNAPELGPIRSAVAQVLRAHEPYPALAVDAGWDVVEANSAVALFLAGCPEDLLRPPLNALRLSLHPDGLAPRIANFAQWSRHILGRLERQASVTGSAALAQLLEELRGYVGDGVGRPEEAGASGVVVPLRFRHEGGELSFLSITTVFGTPLDVTVEELAIETFLPADERTADALRAFADRARMSAPVP